MIWHWRTWNGKRNWRLVLASMLLLSVSGCGLFSHPSRHNEYYCTEALSYDATGKIDQFRYSVDRDCYISMTKKMDACYQGKAQ